MSESKKNVVVQSIQNKSVILSLPITTYLFGTVVAVGPPFLTAQFLLGYI